MGAHFRTDTDTCRDCHLNRFSERRFQFLTQKLPSSSNAAFQIIKLLLLGVYYEIFF